MKTYLGHYRPLRTQRDYRPRPGQQVEDIHITAAFSRDKGPLHSDADAPLSALRGRILLFGVVRGLAYTATRLSAFSLDREAEQRR